MTITTGYTEFLTDPTNELIHKGAHQVNRGWRWVHRKICKPLYRAYKRSSYLQRLAWNGALKIAGKSSGTLGYSGATAWCAIKRRLVTLRSAWEVTKVFFVDLAIAGGDFFPPMPMPRVESRGVV